MKLTKSKNLTGLVLAVLMALPIFSIASRVIYVQANKNAYQSYYGETINKVETTLTNVEDIETNKKYTWNNAPYNDTNNGFRDVNYMLSYLSIDDVENTTYEFFKLYRGSNGVMSFLFYEPSQTTFTLEITGSQNKKVEFIVSSINVVGSRIYYDAYEGFNFYTYNNYSYLDNVFEYSVSQFVKDNDFGNVDLFSYFGNIFLNDSQMNNLYVGFANWYLNYAMLITLMHFLFAILMWFINYSRRILDRSMNYDW